jgi:hypothetical protein
MLMGEVMHLLFVFIFVYSVYCCPTQWPYQMMFESLNSNMTGATNEAWTVYPYGSTTVLYCGSCCLIFIFLCNVLWKTLLSVCPFSFAHGIVCPSSIYSFWLPLWYLHTFAHGIVCPSSIYSFWLPLWYLHTFAHGIVCPSSIYGVWFPLLYLQTFPS